MIERIYDRYLVSPGVFTDTRSPVQNGIFIALRGPNFNANEFAASAIDQGAALAVVDDPAYCKDDRFILVEDCLRALQELARLHRSRFAGPVIALTGSNGKTTTKELIAEVLRVKYQVLATEGNLNNHIGVPLTILKINRSTEIAVIEMGANHIGEIHNLCMIANPDYGMITNIGRAHIEGFGSFEGVLRGKTELYDHLLKVGGRVFINSEDELLKSMGERFPDPLYYPASGDYFEGRCISADPYLKISVGEEELQTQLIGQYNYYNVAAALCISKFFRVPQEKAIEAISGYQPQMNRSQVIKRGTNTIILDAYNANPDSMRVALDNFYEMQAEHKVAILGDMLELGSTAIEEHRELGRMVNGLGIDKVFFCGELVKHSAPEVPDSDVFTTKEELKEALGSEPLNNSLILIKASRGMALETLVDEI